jgi:hypothetical protein
MFGRHHLLSEGAQTEGVVMEANPAPYVRTKDRLTIGVKFDDGQKAEFTEDITNYVQPAAHTLKQLIGNAGGDNVVPLSLVSGDTVPVRYDPADRSKLAIDVPALEERAVQHWAEYRQRNRARAETVLDAQGSAAEPARDSSADVDELQLLAELHREGGLTDEEFADEKRRIIGT